MYLEFVRTKVGDSNEWIPLWTPRGIASAVLSSFGASLRGSSINRLVKICTLVQGGGAAVNPDSLLRLLRPPREKAQRPSSPLPYSIRRSLVLSPFHFRGLGLLQNIQSLLCRVTTTELPSNISTCHKYPPVQKNKKIRVKSCAQGGGCGGNRG